MIAVLRFLVLLVYFIAINLFLIIVFIARPLHRNNVHFGGKVYSSMAKVLGIKLDYRASNKVDPKQTYVCIANHQNTYDLATISHAAIPGVVTMGKKSLKWIPLFGQIYWLSGNIMIDRKDSGKARDTLKQTGDIMRARQLSVWMFPEGTRNKGKGLLPFKTGAFRLALAENKQVVPVVCSELNEGRIKFNRWNNGTVIVEMFDPIDISEYSNARDAAKYLHTFMEEQFTRLSKEALELSEK